MNFDQRKLPQNAAATLRNCPIVEVSPYELMLAPVYVHLKRNKKFVSVKGPLDFFTDEDLERLSPYESFFFPPFVDRSAPFSSAGRRVRVLLTMSEPPPPYEVSDTVLRLIGPLWAPLQKDEAGTPEVLGIEPFFVTVLVNEVCDPINPDLLRDSREKSFARYEHALMQSSWCVFLALHLGYCDREYLNGLRERAFSAAFEQKSDLSDAQEEFRSLLEVMRETYDSPDLQLLTTTLLEAGDNKVVQKIRSRLSRVRTELVDPSSALISVRGEGGLTDE